MANDAHPTRPERSPTVLRVLAAVFLGVAVVHAIVAVHEAVTWPVVAATGCTGLALCLERLVSRSRAADRVPDDLAIPAPRRHDRVDAR